MITTARTMSPAVGDRPPHPTAGTSRRVTHVIPIGGDCPWHGPYLPGSGCPGCAALRAEYADSPALVIGGAA